MQRGPPSPIPAAGGAARGKTVLAEKAADGLDRLQREGQPFSKEGKREGGRGFKGRKRSSDKPSD